MVVFADRSEASTRHILNKGQLEAEVTDLLTRRGRGESLRTLSNFGSNFLVSLLLPTARETVGSRGTYLAFASVGVFALVSMYFTVIETRGKTLEDIETELTAR